MYSYFAFCLTDKKEKICNIIRVSDTGWYQYYETRDSDWCDSHVAKLMVETTNRTYPITEEDAFLEIV